VTRAYAPEAGIDRESNLVHRATVPVQFLVQNLEQEDQAYLPATEIDPVMEIVLVVDYAPAMEIDLATGTDLAAAYVPAMEIDPVRGDRG
tara:strand:+ start:2066 stop:2335 length:270 start_codon:yes stop_codon:yes gene_type:complete